MDLRLTTGQQRLFKDALLDAFTRKELEQVCYGLKLQFAQIVSSGTLDDQVFELVQYVDRYNLVQELLGAALKESPKNIKLRDFAAAIEGLPARHQAASDATEVHMAGVLRSNRQKIESLRKPATGSC